MHSNPHGCIATEPIDAPAGSIRSTPSLCISGPRARSVAPVVWVFATGYLLAGLLWREASAQAFGPRTDFATGDSPYSVAIGDLNGDGRPDLAVANFGIGS